MKKIRNSIFRALFGSIFLMMIIPQVTNAAVGNAVSSGNWNSTSTWSFSGVNRVPTCGDTIAIPSGRTVTVNAQNDLSGCSSVLLINISGTLQFSNGNKLKLPCNSTVDLKSGGVIKKSTSGGGNSTYIEICGTIEWAASDGQLNGPVVLGGNTLPISLLYFKGNAAGDFVELNWSTASEVNNDYFTVERSYDGENFSSVAQLNGAGNSTVTLDYSTRDEMPLKGISYYRLKQTDYDGMYSYSSPVAISYLGENSFEVLAVNSESSIIRVQINDPEGGVREFTVSNLDGRIAGKTIINTQKGSAEYELKGIYLKSGIYTLLVKTETDLWSKKFISN